MARSESDKSFNNVDNDKSIAVPFFFIRDQRTIPSGDLILDIEILGAVISIVLSFSRECHYFFF